MSVVPVETEFGRKRAIDQSSCNKDFSCIERFWPSFVTVSGGRLRKVKGVAGPQHATRIATGEANALIGCDIVVSVADETLVRMQSGLTKAVVNRDFSITSDFVRTMSAQANSGDLTRYRDPQFPLGLMEQQLVDAVGVGNADFVAATRLATALLGDSIATNPFMLGFAYQKGLRPVSGESLIKAIEQHRVAVASNVSAFLLGRGATHDLAAVERVAASGGRLIPESHKLSEDLDQIIARRTADLTAYQNAAYAQRYNGLVDKVRAAEQEKMPVSTKLSEAVARYYYKVLAYKDEYEVARLYSDPGYLKKLNDVFEGDFKLTFHLAPPLWAKPDHAPGCHASGHSVRGC